MCVYVCACVCFVCEERGGRNARGLPLWEPSIPIPPFHQLSIWQGLAGCHGLEYTPSSLRVANKAITAMSNTALILFSGPPRPSNSPTSISRRLRLCRPFRRHHRMCQGSKLFFDPAILYVSVSWCDGLLIVVEYCGGRRSSTSPRAILSHDMC